MENREQRILIHSSGKRFAVFLTLYEIQRAETDQEFLNEITEKYFQLHRNNIIFGKPDEAPTPEAIEDQYHEIIEIQNDMIEETVRNVTDSQETLDNSQSQSDIDDRNGEDNPISIWVIRGRETDDDRQATKYMLRLRGADRFKKKFNDKRTVKLSLWQQIAKEMSVAGFAVGSGRIGARRCQQKFSNLSKTYVNFLKHVNQTGVQKKDPPEYYDDMHIILGGKDKIFPQYTFDSEEGLAGPSHLKSTETPSVIEIETVKKSLAKKPGPIQCTTSTNSTNTPCEENEETIPKENVPDNSRNRLKNVPSKLKPNQNDIVSTIQTIHKDNITIQREQFAKIVELISQQNTFLKQQNDQRDKFIEAIQKFNTTQSNKRKREESDSD